MEHQINYLMLVVHRWATVSLRAHWSFFRWRGNTLQRAYVVLQMWRTLLNGCLMCYVGSTCSLFWNGKDCFGVAFLLPVRVLLFHVYILYIFRFVVQQVISLLGSIGVTILSFVLPPLLHALLVSGPQRKLLYASHRDGNNSDYPFYFDIFSTLVGSVLCVGCTTYTIYGAYGRYLEGEMC